ncbi:hypothetical protein GCM10007205_08230 [Oxalicibacterium flavum]|uniref:Efflux transporter periplasmic adaptor subunit n=2 Tax=Oxalicibacterium flavum TaxID=179467 RepID=A0A8J2ULD7_9BURK|nr:hypothetical protein GCM10007205_08230 [Oxalicibacterium flavum]
MKNTLNKKQTLAIAIILVVGLLLGGLILLSDRQSASENGHAHEHGKQEHADDDHDHGEHAHDDDDDGHDHGDEKEGKPAPAKEEGHADDKVAMSAAQISAAAIRILAADHALIRTVSTLPGEIRFNDDRTAHIVPRVAGVVQSVPANLGQQVKKGEVMAVMASTAVSEQRSELLAAQKRLTLARLTWEREKTLWEEKISAEQDFLQARQAVQEAEIAVQNARQKLAAIGAATDARDALNRYEIRAPFDGIVVEKHISLGEALKEDAAVFTLSDLSTVWAEIAVPAGDLDRVRVGEKVTVKADAFDSSASGTVAHVGSLLGAQTRTATARVTLANPKGSWRPGLFVTVEVLTGEAEVPVAVTREAVHRMEGRDTVFVRTADGFAAQTVRLGRSDGRMIEIVEGLQAGTEYAADNSFVVRSELGKAGAEHAH